MQMPNLDPTNDALFKSVFANRARTHIPLAFVNAVLAHRGTPLMADIALLDRELSPDFQGGKESRLDFLGKSSDGTKANVELQVEAFQAMERRSLYYWTRLYQDLHRGEPYTDLRCTVSINILDYNWKGGANFPSFHSCFGVYDIETGQQLTTDLEIHFIELRKWKAMEPPGVDEMSPLERWLCYFSKRKDLQRLEEIAMKEPAIRDALHAESVFTQDEAMRLNYERAEIARRDRLAALDYAREEGLSLGIDRGIDQGTRSTVRGFLAAGVSAETAAKATGWPLEDVLALQREIKQ